jgi:hypothetical protein
MRRHVGDALLANINNAAIAKAFQMFASGFQHDEPIPSLLRACPVSG